MLAANVFWAIAYDTEYAMVDRDDDLKIGIRTSAITFGRHDVAAVMVSYAAALVLLGLVGCIEELGPLYYGGLVVAAGIAAYHWTLIRERDRDGHAGLGVERVRLRERRGAVDDVAAVQRAARGAEALDGRQRRRQPARARARRRRGRRGRLW
jgi:hypothetical protein